MGRTRGNDEVKLAFIGYVAGSHEPKPDRGDPMVDKASNGCLSRVETLAWAFQRWTFFGCITLEAASTQCLSCRNLEGCKSTKSDHDSREGGGGARLVRQRRVPVRHRKSSTLLGSRGQCAHHAHHAKPNYCRPCEKKNHDQTIDFGAFTYVILTF